MSRPKKTKNPLLHPPSDGFPLGADERMCEVAHICEFLSVSEHWVYETFRPQVEPDFVLGRRLRWHTWKVLAWVDAHQRQSQVGR